ncbi:low density lipoprotein receptor adapter protein 1-like isoform X2 [Phymastichus coffea]|uniref:low density lipoprotein receptor adapter protein 1-like isoform X2 n=1 Tax=Phymastichus coffea TaxID=108790 RepID=UPI00273AAD13|nr:low density lipoprotein receptor adapter protein 1-like isoform X2 [Phymastichus coffea]
MSFLRGLWRSNSKHKKLCEEWALANSCESVGPSTSSGSTSASASSSRTGPEDAEAAPETSFTLKYLGSTMVESPNSEEETAEAIKTIMTVAKASGKKAARVSLAVSLRGIRMTDLTTEEEQLRISIYRISYCSADAAYPQVFAFIATNLNETMECHAYECAKRKAAHSVCLTVAQAFNAAYELWQLSQLDSRMYHAHDKSPKLADDKKDKKADDSDSDTDEEASGSQKNLILIDLAKDAKARSAVKTEAWVSFVDETASANDDGIALEQMKSPTSSVSSTSSGQAMMPAESKAEIPTKGPPDLVCTS